MLGDAGEHLRADLRVVVKGPNIVWVADSLQGDVGGTLKGLGRPADS